MTQQQRRRYTDEVLVAMREAGVLPDASPPAPPLGQLRYHLAVEQIQLSGAAPAATVALILRNLADQLDLHPSLKENQHG